MRREPMCWVAEVFGVRAILRDEVVDPASASRLDVGATIDAWILTWNIDSREMFFYFVDKGPSTRSG